MDHPQISSWRRPINRRKPSEYTLRLPRYHGFCMALDLFHTSNPRHFTACPDCRFSCKETTGHSFDQSQLCPFIVIRPFAIHQKKNPERVGRVWRAGRDIASLSRPDVRSHCRTPARVGATSDEKSKVRMKPNMRLRREIMVCSQPRARPEETGKPKVARDRTRCRGVSPYHRRALRSNPRNKKPAES